MSDVQSLIKLLQSNDHNKRYDACELLRVSPSLPLEALDALKKTTNDENPDVADAARRAIELHSQAANSPLHEMYQTTPNSTANNIWHSQENQKGKLIVVISLFCLAFVITAPIPAAIVAVWAFPYGLFQSFFDWDRISSTPIPLFFIGLGWSFYYGISHMIVKSNNRWTIRLLFIVLVLLLLLNIHGCRETIDDYFS